MKPCRLTLSRTAVERTRYILWLILHKLAKWQPFWISDIMYCVWSKLKRGNQHNVIVGFGGGTVCILLSALICRLKAVHTDGTELIITIILLWWTLVIQRLLKSDAYLIAWFHLVRFCLFAASRGGSVDEWGRLSLLSAL